jgi:hypothetical protein
MLTFIVPGLFWPQQALIDLTRDLPLPALTTLLGRGRLQRRGASSLHECIAAETGLPYPLPAAALRRPTHSGFALGSEICLDPVHLRFEERTLVLDDPQHLQLDASESHALTVSLASTFAGLGELIEHTPGCWNLRLTSPAPAFIALPEASARAVEPLPLDAIYAPWRRALNEAQMVLHGHPVNQAREAARRPVINSLWPWGGGVLPPASSRHAVLWSNDPLRDSIARHCGMASAVLPPSLTTNINQPTLVTLDTLALPLRSGDGLSWREHITALETDWFAPALAALKSGRLDGLCLIATGTPEHLELRVHKRDLWKFWRPPLPITALTS